MFEIYHTIRSNILLTCIKHLSRNYIKILFPVWGISWKYEFWKIWVNDPAWPSWSPQEINQMGNTRVPIPPPPLNTNTHIQVSASHYSLHNLSVLCKMHHVFGPTYVYNIHEVFGTYELVFKRNSIKIFESFIKVKRKVYSAAIEWSLTRDDKKCSREVDIGTSYMYTKYKYDPCATFLPPIWTSRWNVHFFNN